MFLRKFIIVLIASLIFIVRTTHAQIETAIESWKKISRVYDYSPDGKYVVYGIEMETKSDTKETVFVKSVKSPWKYDLNHSSTNVKITGDSKYSLVQTDDGRLIFVQNGMQYTDRQKPVELTNVVLFYLIKSLDKYLVGVLSKEVGESMHFSIYTLNGKVILDIPDTYWVSSSNTNKIIVAYSNRGGTTLRCIDANLKSTEISINMKPGNVRPLGYVQNDKALVINTLNRDIKNVSNLGVLDSAIAIWRFEENTFNAVKLHVPIDSMIISNVSIVADQNSQLNTDRGIVKLSMTKLPVEKKDGIGAKLKIYGRGNQTQVSKNTNAKDIFILADYRNGVGYTISNNALLPLNTIENSVIFSDLSAQDTQNDTAEKARLVYANLSSGVVSDSLFTKQKIAQMRTFGDLNESPNKRYRIGYVDSIKAYVAYDRWLECTRVITPSNVDWGTPYLNDFRNVVRGVAAWDPDSNGNIVWIYDKFDIWRIDITGRDAARCITNGFGRRNKIVLTFQAANGAKIGARIADKWILNAFKTDTKENGFVAAGLDGKEPQILYLGQCFFQCDGNLAIDGAHNKAFWKAADRNEYLVFKTAPNSSTNIYYTSDFKHFELVSDVFPEQQENRYETKLLSWQINDSTTSYGALFIPPNLDTTKKYPVVIKIYEKLADNLFINQEPAYLDNGCTLNVFDYLHSGYAVFLPDVTAKEGDPMPGVLASFVPALNALKKNRWIDPERIGLQGCSWGGTEVNYIVTHFDGIRAANAASAFSNFVTSYGEVSNNGIGLAPYFLYGQGRMRTDLWKGLDKYIQNSSYFHVKDCNTPLLIMHTKYDDVCSIETAIAYFNALRYFKKNVWLIEYLEGNHGIFGEKAIDFSYRLKSYFNYYLKDEAMPDWMQ
ncbi:S9 family peptidase [Chitinophaga sp. Cy-1792]|uniref:alpha/beta hydrolase family protein n=1 Tax=Chitinophaga sp. Cy-1792 TaxID=2608339 RepID=UPI00142152E2|nr:prolyl oligopeptidase family serine peptidase [Chitinophaga sp. Cy-1792]NIG57505.1 prolyl oligopeptidase family serine peptidase [Chitinophaga sp. Cy-1792]